MKSISFCGLERRICWFNQSVCLFNLAEQMIVRFIRMSWKHWRHRFANLSGCISDETIESLLSTVLKTPALLLMEMWYHSHFSSQSTRLRKNTTASVSDDETLDLSSFTDTMSSSMAIAFNSSVPLLVRLFQFEICFTSLGG